MHRKMCNSFLHFFIDNVATARALIATPTSDPSDPVPCSAVFDLFEPVSSMALKYVVSQIKPSGSPCDTVPPHFFKEVFPSIGQLVLAIINSSLSSCVVPQNFKHAVLQPLLKKPGLDCGTLANYRPISVFQKSWKKLSMLSGSHFWMSMVSWRSSSLVLKHSIVQSQLY